MMYIHIYLLINKIQAKNIIFHNVKTNEIDIASIKTIYNNEKSNDIVKNYGLIIIDECHHSSAYTYENTHNTVNAKYVYGVSATPEKENGHTPIINMQCGNMILKKSLMKEKIY